MNKLKEFVQKETVLSVAIILAVISMFIVPPNAEYSDYINWRVLAILTGLMIVMAGYKKLGIFTRIAQGLLSHIKSSMGIYLILVFLCFFFSMLVTNDVALITFVPLAIETLTFAGRRDKIIPVVVMQTVAANLGSMLTPVGNPQNLLIYEQMGVSFGEFLGIMLPLTVASGLLIVVVSLFWMRDGSSRDCGKKNVYTERSSNESGIQSSRMQLILYTILFALNLLVVLKVVPAWLALVVTVVLVMIVDIRQLLAVDYSLIFTFIGFFIFVGNMGSIGTLRDMLQSALAGRELELAVLSSQFISNVPATALLIGFTDNYKALLYGVDIGGLGTLIASMASLISYKYVARLDGDMRKPYLRAFTVINVGFLVILLGMCKVFYLCG